MAPNIAAGDPAGAAITTFLSGWVNRSGPSHEWKRVPVWSVHFANAMKDSIRVHGRNSPRGTSVIIGCADNPPQYKKVNSHVEDITSQHKHDWKKPTLQFDIN